MHCDTTPIPHIVGFHAVSGDYWSDVAKYDWNTPAYKQDYLPFELGGISLKYRNMMEYVHNISQPLPTQAVKV